MLIVENCIISENIADRCFCCDLSQCKGQCCVEGDAGAPLDENEVPVLERIYPQVEPYMTEAGRRAVAEQGLAIDDNAGEPCTPLVANRECAYVVWEDGCAFCAIEKAFRDGKIDYMKPVSCHLYPIRVDNYGEFISLNYHEWDVCRSAVCKGRETGVPLYKYLKEPLIRRFGQKWYDELCQQVRARTMQ
ncbi:MAG: DUF3109 family protein [Bacteroidales bacterium]|nr:DUF3109 family protein [Bacteroidales bacterium]